MFAITEGSVMSCKVYYAPAVSRVWSYHSRRALRMSWNRYHRSLFRGGRKGWVSWTLQTGVRVQEGALGWRRAQSVVV